MFAQSVMTFKFCLSFFMVKFGAGFGKGGTSMPFWENVYGFNMSCVGKELGQDAARRPIVDTLDPLDIITESAVIHVRLGITFQLNFLF